MQIRQRLVALLGLILFAGCTGPSEPITDDFSDPDSGWRSASAEAFTRGYDSGQYLIRIDVPDWFVWATSGLRYSDVSIEVTARSEGMTDNHYGVLCRQSDKGAYYFAISADGYYAIFLQNEDKTLTPLTGDAMLRSSLIHKGTEPNQLLAVCEGEEFTFYINGEQVTQITDDTLSHGDVGMAAGTAANATATLVWFDDMTISKP